MKLRLGPLVATWYAASIAAIWTAKIVLQELACPATLAAVQFAVAAAGVHHTTTSNMNVASPQHERASAPGTRCLLPSSSRGPLSDVELRAVRGVSLTYTLGFLLTNAAIAAAAPSFVETVKAAEPRKTPLGLLHSRAACSSATRSAASLARPLPPQKGNFRVV